MKLRQRLDGWCDQVHALLLPHGPASDRQKDQALACPRRKLDHRPALSAQMRESEIDGTRLVAT